MGWAAFLNIKNALLYYILVLPNPNKTLNNIALMVTVQFILKIKLNTPLFDRISIETKLILDSQFPVTVVVTEWLELRTANVSLIQIFSRKIMVDFGMRQKEYINCSAGRLWRCVNPTKQNNKSLIVLNHFITSHFYNKMLRRCLLEYNW